MAIVLLLSKGSSVDTAFESVYYGQLLGLPVVFLKEESYRVLDLGIIIDDSKGRDVGVLLIKE